MADAAAASNLMRCLFAKDVVQQSIRLGLAEAWEGRYPNLLEEMTVVQEHCPTLVQSFLPTSEQDLENDMGIGFGEDEAHSAIRASLTGFIIDILHDNDFNIRANVNMSKLDSEHHFLQQLGNAYTEDYGVRNVLDFGSKRLEWKQRMAYTDP